MANRITQTFQSLKRQRRKALIGYVTAGHPTRASLASLVPLLEKSGVDILEIGVPFSDPMADGPTIQQSSQIGLANGATLSWILKSIAALRKNGVRLPLVLMSYCNPIYSMGLEAFFRAGKAAGVDGLIIPDLIPEESKPYATSARRHGIDLIFLAAPTTPERRIRMIAGKTSGFLYAVSLTGVTGVRSALPMDAVQFLRTVKSISRKPVAVGFGLSTPQQVRKIALYADGVIVGSALVRHVEQSSQHHFKGAVRFVQSLRRALDS